MNSVEEEIRKDIADFLCVDIQQLENEENLVLDYHLDSLDIFRLSIKLEDKYGIHYNTMRHKDFTSVSAIVKETIRLLNQNA